MIEKRPSLNPGKVLVTFRVDRSVWADDIRLMGDFNAWGQTEISLVRTPVDPDWHTTLELDAGRRYRFGYLMDGRQLSNDSKADGYLTDSLGKVYSVVDASTVATPMLQLA